MLLRTLLPAVLLLGCAEKSLVAQQLRHVTLPSADSAEQSPQVDRNRAGYLSFAVDTADRDHRWEGIVLGGLLVGLGGALLGNSLCEAEEDCTRPTVGIGLIGATLGVVVGGIVGSTIPKE